MREERERSMIVEKLLAYDHCSDIFQLPTGKCKGHDADENILKPLVGKCGGGYTGSDKPIADFFAHHKGKMNCFLGAAETLVRQSIDEYLKDGREHLQVAFGYTGGQHRSVYFAERMSERPAGTDGVEIEVSHVARSGWRK